MTAQLAPNPVFRSWDNLGLPLVGGKLNTYAAGTNARQATYTDSTQGTPNTNPVILNFRGEAFVWLDPTLAYKFVLTDAVGNLIWTEDNIQGGINVNSNITPSQTNTFTLGTPSLTWANGYFGPNGAPVFDPVSGNIGYYKQTTAEAAVPVMPAIFVPTLHIDIERYGGIADNATDNAAAMTRALSVLTQRGGGTLLFPSTGTYKTSGSILMPGKTRFQGDGMQASFLQYTGSGTFITFTNTGGTNDIEDMGIFGTGKVGIGIQFGDATSFAGLCNMRRHFVSGFATGIRMGGALWATIEDGRIQNNTVGIDFNASFASGHCNVVEIARNQISFNDHEGIAASNVPVRNQNIRLVGGSCEQNGATDLTRYQFVTGAVEQLTIENVYFEYAAGGTKPNGINLNGASNWAIRECFFNTLGIAIGSTSTNNGTIDTSRFIGSTVNDLNLSGGANVHDIEISNTNTLSGAANVLAGTNVQLYTAARAQQIATTVGWTPTIRGATVAGTPTYTVQSGTYSKVGNLVYFQVRVSISAKTAISGALSIEGLPLASAIQAGSSAIFAAEYSGVTVSSSNTYLYAEQANNSTSILLMQGGSTSNSQLTDTNIAAATTVVISGCYQTTS